MGYTLSDQELQEAFERFKRLADQKKELFEEDLEAIVNRATTKVPERFSLKALGREKWVQRTSLGDGRIADEWAIS